MKVGGIRISCMTAAAVAAGCLAACCFVMAVFRCITISNSSPRITTVVVSIGYTLGLMGWMVGGGVR